MSARAEVPTPVQQSPAELNGARAMSIALIGPNDTHRKIMVKALSGAQNRTVREFIDYPASLSEVPRLLEQRFDVVMIDVDSDESYALALVESIAATGKATVIAYSKRTDQSLMSRCGRAGAQDFLPLPTEGQDGEASATPTAAEAAPPAGAGGLHVVERPAVKDEHSQSRIEPTVAMSADSVIDAKQLEDSRPKIADVTRTDASTSDFKDWDAEHLFSMMPAAAKQAAAAKAKEAAAREAAAKEAAVKEAAAKEAAAKEAAAREAAAKEAAAKEALKAQEAIAKAKQEILKTAAVAPAPAAKISPAKIAPAHEAVSNAVPTPEETPVEHVSSLLASPPPRIKLTEDMPLFRAEVKEEEAKGPRNDFMKWVFIAAGLGLLAGLLLLIFMHPSRQAPPAAPAVQPAQSQPQTPAPAPELSNTTAKPSPIPPPTATTTNVVTTAVAETPTKQVSSEMMDAQLSAPSMISKDIKKAKPAEEPPPSGLTPVSIDSGSVPGQVFGSGNNPKVVPQVSAISAGVASGMLLYKTEPVYPMIAKESHVSGTVVVKATITKAGTIEGAQMVSGPKMLGPAALDAVKAWRYRPYMLDNKPVAVETTINVVFKLGDR